MAELNQKKTLLVNKNLLPDLSLHASSHKEGATAIVQSMHHNPSTTMQGKC
jgi:hypothetical protein